MSTTDDTNVAFYVSVTNRTTGEPNVRIGADGELNIWPADLGGPYLSVSVEGWRKICAAVDRAIEEAATSIEAAAR